MGVCVYPVKAAPDLDFSNVPRWMSSLHFYDLDQQWQKFINDLNTRCQEPHVPFMCKDLPTDFVPRPNEFDALISKLLDEQREEPVAITAALRGAGGYGKTTMAMALCHDVRIQDAFDDGILWVELGENPDNLVGKLENLIYFLSEKRPGFTSIDAASIHLTGLLADRDILLVIDDVWNSTHLEPFLQGGKRCARLVTTRNEQVLRADVPRIQVDAMQPDQAVQLLGSGLSSIPLDASDTTALAALAKRLSKWALLLKLANGVLRERISRGQPLPDALVYINTAFDKRSLTAFDDKNALDRNRAVAKTLSVSFDMLSTDENARYHELAVFSEEVDIPLVTLQRLWGAIGGLDDFGTEELCERLYRFSLLLNFDLMTRTIRLHDVERTYLRSEVGGKGLSILHGQLLNAYGLQRWADLPKDEPYIWDHLADHLIGANRVEELMATVKDLRYVARKALLRGVYSCQTDLIIAANALPNDVPLSLLTRNIINMSHLLKQCETFSEIASVLCSRLRHLEGLSELCHAFEQKLPRPYFSPWHTLPDLPHPALICILQGHTDSVNGCAVSPDGSYIVSASDDHTLKIWDAQTGQERLTLRGHTSSVTGCVVSPLGDRIVSTSHDKTLRVWDTLTGQEYLTLQEVSECAVSPKGDFIVSISRTGLKVWDTQTGVEYFTLQAPGSASFMDLALLDAPTIVERFTLELWSGDLDFSICAVSPNGSYIVSASRDGTIQIWDTMTGRERFTLHGHTRSVKGCAVSSDGYSIISVSDDRSLKVWNVQTGQERVTLRGHTHWVNGCALSPKGKKTF